MNIQIFFLLAQAVPEGAPAPPAYLPVVTVSVIAFIVYVISQRRKARKAAVALEKQLARPFYYLCNDNEVAGPVSLKELGVRFSASPGVLVCGSGSEDWLSLADATQQAKAGPLLPEDETSEKRILPASLLCFLLGTAGFHAFYVGRPVRGLIMFLLGTWLTLCLVTALQIPGQKHIELFTIPAFIFAIMWLSDILNLLLGKYVDGTGKTLRVW